MEYHKIPQNVSVYEGRIIGKFTARQFTYLAIGGIIVFLLATLPIGMVYKSIFILITVIWTALFALVSYEGRGTDLWIALYTKAILLPTLRIWAKAEEPPIFLLTQFTVQRKREETTPKQKEELERFLTSWAKKEENKDFTEEEKIFLGKLKTLKSKILKTNTSNPSLSSSTQKNSLAQPLNTTNDRANPLNLTKENLDSGAKEGKPINQPPPVSS